MIKSLKQIFVGAALCALLCGVACAQRAKTVGAGPTGGKGELAEQLISLSQLHVVYAESVAAGFRASATRNGAPAEEIDCVVKGMSPELFRPVLNEAYAAEFSEDELRQAIAFFESPAGKTYIRHTMATLREAFNLPTEKAPELTAAESERVDAFLATRLAAEMGDRESKVSKTVRETLRPRLLEIFRQCDKSRKR